MSLVVDGVPYEIPGIPCVSWLEDSSIRLNCPQDGCKRRAKFPNWAVWHMTRGKKRKKYLPGLGPPGLLAERNAWYWRRAKHSAGAHLILDQDGTLVQTADLLLEVAYAAPGRNGDGIQIEIAEDGTGDEGIVYDGQLDVAADLALYLSATLGIPAAAQSVYRGRAVKALTAGNGANLAGGHIQHCDCDNNRGLGDAGPELRARMIARGLIPVDFGARR